MREGGNYSSCRILRYFQEQEIISESVRLFRSHNKSLSLSYFHSLRNKRQENAHSFVLCIQQRDHPSGSSRPPQRHRNESLHNTAGGRLQGASFRQHQQFTFLQDAWNHPDQTNSIKESYQRSFLARSQADVHLRSRINKRNRSRIQGTFKSFHTAIQEVILFQPMP